MDINSNYNYVISQLGNDFIEAGNYELRYQCPFCKEMGKHYDDYKLYVNYKKMKYFCQRCQSSGILKLDDVLKGGSNSDASSILESILSNNSEKDEDESDYFLIPKFQPVPNTLAWDYLMKRHITPSDISKYSIRVPSLSDDSKFQGRVIIPNRVISRFWTDMYNARSYIDDPVRYKNPSSSKKSKIVFNLHNIKDNPGRIIINEGAINSIVAGEDSVASFGKYISDEQLQMILSKRPKKVYISLDTDARDNAEELCRKVIEMSNSEVYLVELPEYWDETKGKMKGLDASDLGRDKYNEYLNNARRYVSKSIYLISKYIEELNK